MIDIVNVNDFKLLEIKSKKPRWNSYNLKISKITTIGKGACRTSSRSVQYCLEMLAM